MKKTLFLILTLFFCQLSFSQFGKNGSLTLTTGTNVINQYASITANIATNQNFIIVSNIADLTSGTALTCGDLIMVYQAQGASMDISNTAFYGTVLNVNNAGLFEYRHVLSVNGNTITLDNPLNNSYSINGHIQAVRVPQYTKLTINSGVVVTGINWDGTKGGIVSIHCSDSLIVNGTIKANGIGFRGGIVNTTSAFMYNQTSYLSSAIGSGGEKGEGICGNQTEYLSMGGNLSRGAPGNAGGGGTATNTGGGGGANVSNGNIYNGAGVMCSTCTGASAWTMDADYISNGNALTNSSGGGKGGNSGAAFNGNALVDPPGATVWGSDKWRNVAGRGGRPLINVNSAQRVYFGGAGGAGDANNNSGSSGGNGGGLIYLMTPKIIGTGTIIANGNNSLNSHNTHDDGQGGGGGGGSIVLNSNSVSSSISVISNGGQGGTVIANTTYLTGPGGGGGGGYISSPVGSNPLLLVNGGKSGLSMFSWISEFPVVGATDGGSGLCQTVSTFTVATDFITSSNSTVSISSSPSNTICSGNSVTITPNGTISYSLAPTNIIGSTFIVTPTITTTYTITNALATCIPTFTTITIYVNNNPTLTINTSSICSGQTSTLTVNGVDSYTWSPAIGLSSTTGSIVMATLNSTQGYTVSATNNSSCSTTSTTSVIVYPLPNILINSINCIGAPTATFIATGANSYSWDPTSDLSSSTGSLVTLSSTVTTIYTVTGTDSNGCFSSLTTNNSISIPPANIIINTSTICSGQQTATLIAQGANSFTWNPAIGLNSTTGSVVLANPTTTQNYTVTGANSGCVSTGTTTVFVNIPASISVNSTSICIGQQKGILIASGANSYTWNPATGLDNAYSNIVFTQPTATQNYTVSGLDNNGCVASGIANVVVYNLPFVLAPNDTLIPYGDSIQLTGTGNGQLAWISGNNLNCNHCSDPFVVPTTNSCYILQATDNNGCINKDVICVTLDIDYEIYIPNCFTPNNDGLNDVFMVAGYGIQEIELDIFDRWGQLIFHSLEMSDGWDGNYKGIPCQNDAYTYALKYTTVSKQNKAKFGHVTLLGKNR